MSQTPDWEADTFTLSAGPAPQQALCPTHPPASSAVLRWSPDSQHLVAYWHAEYGDPFDEGVFLKLLCFSKDTAAVSEVSNLTAMRAGPCLLLLQQHTCVQLLHC